MHLLDGTGQSTQRFIVHFRRFPVVLINPLQNVIPGIPGLVSIVAVLIARAISVSAIVAGLNVLKIIRADFFGLTQLLTWSGLRGGLSLVLPVSLARQRLETADPEHDLCCRRLFDYCSGTDGPADIFTGAACRFIAVTLIY